MLRRLGQVSRGERGTGGAGARRQESRDPGTHKREEGTMMGRRQCRGYLLIWAHRRVTGTDIAGGEAPSVLSTVYPDTEIVSTSIEYLQISTNIYNIYISINI